MHVGKMSKVPMKGGKGEVSSTSPTKKLFPSVVKVGKVKGPSTSPTKKKVVPSVAVLKLQFL